MPFSSTIARLLRLLSLPADTGLGLGLPTLWLKRARDRHLYSSLSAEQMRDAGLNPERIAREAAKNFWQP
jgi:uncharacterized protein YjiS (DUF1127 family)